MFHIKSFSRQFIIYVLFIQFFSTQMQGFVNCYPSETKQFMSGKVIRIAVSHYPPITTVTKNQDGKISYSGAVFDVFNFVANALNISYEVVMVTEEDLKKYGIGPSQLKLISNDEADLVTIGIVPSHDKFKQFDFTTPLIIEPYRLLVPWPREESRLLAPIRPFQLPVWIGLVVSFILVASSWTSLMGLYQKYINLPVDASNNVSTTAGHLKSFSENILYLWSHLTKNRYYLTLKSRASYIIVCIWCLMTVVLANAYAGTLLAFLSVPKLEPVINSLEELANSENVRLIITARSELAFRFLNSSKGIEKLIGDSLRKNPENMFYDPREMKKKLITGKFALAQFNVINYGLIDATYRENNKKCKITLAKEPIAFFAPAVQVLAKNGPFTKAISEQFQAQIDVGLVNYYMRRYMPRIDQCFIENQKNSARQKTLSLIEISSAFVVLGLGIGFSLLAFLFELACSMK